MRNLSDEAIKQLVKEWDNKKATEIKSCCKKEVEAERKRILEKVEELKKEFAKGQFADTNIGEARIDGYTWAMEDVEKLLEG